MKKHSNSRITSLLKIILILCTLSSFDYSEPNKEFFSFLKLSEISNKAEAGDLSNMATMATMYLTGYGVKADYHEALRWRQKMGQATNLPMYSLNASPVFEAEAAKMLIHNHNGTFSKEVIDLEEAILDSNS